MKTIRLVGKKEVELQKIDPKTGVAWYSDKDGNAYLYYDGRIHKAELTAK